MAETLVVVTGTTITHDETAGLQNSVATPSVGGDADDDDVSVSSIPTAFSSRLTALSAPATVIGAAMSPGNVVTFVPTGTLGNIALTDEDGAPLNGDDSGLDTTDGQDILLYTDTANDNIVLGRAGGSTGDIVFAIYLEETGGTPPTGAKLWTVQYEAIDHGDDLNDHDSAVDLTGLVHVTAFEEQNFSFANAPSGQNLFMAFGTTSQAILVTGEDPADESAGENVSNDGDTVNTGKGGGATTLGTEGQQIKAQKALVFTFVSGTDPGLLVPNLSPTEAGVESNIDFSGYVLAKGAEITISQMTPGGSTTATVELAAYLTADTAGDGYIDGSPLVAGDTAINIATVQVIRGGLDVVGTEGVSVNLTGSTAVVTGVRNGDLIRYTTDADHNRVLVRNDQPTSGAGKNVAFDLGGFRLTQVAGDTDEVGSNIFFEDDGPSITTGTNPTALTVDETTLGTDASGSFASQFNVAFGTDGQASTGALAYALGIGVVGANSGLVDSATGNSVFLFLSGGTITGKEGTSLADAETGETVFVISVNATGVVTLDQQRAVIHSPDTGPDQAVTLADNVITLTATATDGDTDTASKTEDVGDRFTFKDDAPTAGTNTAVQLDDETAQSTLGTPPNLGGTGDATGTSATANGTLAHSFGADGAGTVLLTSATLPASGGFSQSLSVDNKTLTISQLQNGASVEVVKIEVTNAATGAYTVTHLAQVFHPTPGTTEEDVTFTVNYQVTDKDGDTASSSINVNVDDDTPTIAAGTNPTALTVDETTLATNDSGSFASLFNVSYGADGQASTGALAYALGIGVVGADSGLDDTLTGNSVFLFLSGGVITGKEGTSLADAATGDTVFVISVGAAAGVVTLDQQRAVIHSPDTGPDQAVTLADNVITLTATAKDGDLDTGGHTENVGDRFIFKDDAPAVTVEDATGNYTAGAQGSWDHAPGADGFQSLSVTFDSYEIDANGSVDTTVDNFTQTDDFHYTGSITDDFNGDGTDETVEFTLTFDPDDPETYDLQVTTPPETITDFSTADGSLDAGGPDPVRTLTVGDVDIVFSAVNALATPTNATPAKDAIADFLNDSEATIQTTAPFLSPNQMNVSTAGIGLADNLFEGNSITGIDGATTSGGKIDESFVIDPHIDVSSVEVIINDQTNGGYTPANEDLYYRIYYTDGTTSGEPTKVLAADLDPAGFHQVSFTVGDPNGPNDIDAVQLIMGRGTIKVPTIEFTASQTFNPESLHLDFTATLFDGDGDSSEDAFSVDLLV